VLVALLLLLLRRVITTRTPRRQRWRRELLRGADDTEEVTEKIGTFPERKTCRQSSLLVPTMHVGGSAATQQAEGRTGSSVDVYGQQQ